MTVASDPQSPLLTAFYPLRVIPPKLLFILCTFIPVYIYAHIFPTQEEKNNSRHRLADTKWTILPYSSSHSPVSEKNWPNLPLETPPCASSAPGPPGSPQCAAASALACGRTCKDSCHCVCPARWAPTPRSPQKSRIFPEVSWTVHTHARCHNSDGRVEMWQNCGYVLHDRIDGG